MHGQDGTALDNSIAMLGISDHVAPVRLTSGFASGSMINTSFGLKPVEQIHKGDLVHTSEHGLQPVRYVISQEVPILGRFAPIHLHAPFFGLTRDLIVAPDHRILITGVDAEYLFGTDSVLLEARHLAKMADYPGRRRATTVKYVQLVLETHMCVSVSGAWAESQYLGELADRPNWLALSPLAGIPAIELPRHTHPASQQLKGYEAMLLVSALCA